MPSRALTIIYDAECEFCNEQIARIKRWDTRHRFQYLPAQSEEVTKRFPVLKEMNLEEGMRVVSEDNQVSVGADAVYEIARNLGPTRPWAWLYQMPGLKQLARWVYQWIAANRKRLGKTCSQGSCKQENNRS